MKSTQKTTNPFDGLLSFAEAAQEWGLGESTLRYAMLHKRFEEGVEVRKFGKQWVVTRSAMERLYGEPQGHSANEVPPQE